MFSFSPSTSEKRRDLYNQVEREEMLESLASVLRSQDFEEFGGERSVGDSAGRNEHVINMNSGKEQRLSSMKL